MQTLQVMSDWLGVGSACSSAAWVGSSSASPLTSSISLSLSESTSPVSLNLLVCRLAMASTYLIGVMGLGLPVSRRWMRVSILLWFAVGLRTRSSSLFNCLRCSTELNSALHYNWSKFDKWQIWTYFHWTWFDSLNHIRELESPNLFIKTSIILIRELKTLNLFIKTLMILIRDFKSPNLIHWTCLNWT